MDIVEKYKVKRMLDELTNCKGNGTSLITLMIQSGGDLAGMKRMLVDEYGTATNIKSRVNKQSVLSAITSCQQKLKQYNKLPPNGLVVLCGEAFVKGKNRVKKVCEAFEPVKPLSVKMYMCDGRFHTEPLYAQLDDETQYGFIVVDGSGALFAQVAGDNKNILYHYKVDLPKKHKKGGQSSARFGRLAEEARMLYIRRVVELATKYFIDTNSNAVNVKALILAGSADMKDRLFGDKTFDPRIKDAIASLVSINYGGEPGLEEAISKSGAILADLKLLEEKNILSEFFKLLDKSPEMVCFGIRDAMYALEQGAIDKLLLWDDLPLLRYVVLEDVDGEPKEMVCFGNSLDNENRQVISSELFLDWILENYKSFGTALHIVSKASAEGNQFAKGFGGIGGLLRWAVQFDILEISEEDEEDGSSWEEDDFF